MHPLNRHLADTLGFSPVAWVRDTRRMRRLVGAFQGSRSPKPDAVRFAIVVTPWMGTAVPWFSLACGLLLASGGNNVTFVVDDIPFGRHALRFRFVLRCVRSVLKRLRGKHKIINLSEHVSSAPLSPVAQQAIARLAELNAVWSLRGEMAATGRQQYVERVTSQLGASHSAIATVLDGGRYDAIFVPGGVWGSTGVWTAHARAFGVRVASFDSGGYGTLMLAVNGIACQLQDIPRAFSLLKQHAESPGEKSYVVETALAEIGRRRAGVDKFTSQMQSTRAVDPRFSGAVLLALNSSWDSAALGLHSVFANSTEWIVETTRYLLDNTSRTIIVRQHPAERLEIARTSDDYRGLLARHFGNHPRLHFIAADEPVNSYDLLDRVAAVVVYTSTIGIEAAVHHKAVVTASNSYYADLGFVRKASSLAQYHEYLTDAAAGRAVVTPTMRDDALSCYYLTQCCNWVFSPFNPEGFTEWSRHDLAQLEQHDKVQATVQALEQNVPVAFLNHLARLEQEAVR